MNADRKQRAHLALEFCHVLARDKQGKALKVRVPGHLGKMHEVILRWREHEVSAECLVDVGLGYNRCSGQGWVDYHCIAAVMYAFREQGYKMSLGEVADLKKLKNFGQGFIIGIRSWISGQGVDKGEMIWARAIPMKKVIRTVHHLDGDWNNNEISNLQIVDIRENRSGEAL
jgi:hypothetical protein